MHIRANLNKGHTWLLINTENYFILKCDLPVKGNAFYLILVKQYLPAYVSYSFFNNAPQKIVHMQFYENF